MPSVTSYDQQLRAIGQSLEARRITVFELKSETACYVVRGVPEKDSHFLGRLRLWRERLNGASPDASMTYNMASIERLDQNGRLKRLKPDRLPDFYSLSNALRTVGCYLDSKNAELMELHKSPLSITLLYQNESGHPHMEERSVASFYNLFVAMHGRRDKVNNPAVAVK